VVGREGQDAGKDSKGVIGPARLKKGAVATIVKDYESAHQKAGRDN
jgi:hypothetical protein